MLELTSPQVHRRMTTYDRQLGLDADVMNRATESSSALSATGVI